MTSRTKPQLQQDMEYPFSTNRSLKSRMPAASGIYTGLGSKEDWDDTDRTHLIKVTRALYATLYKRFPKEAKQEQHLSQRLPTRTTIRRATPAQTDARARKECSEAAALINTFEEGTGKEHVPDLLTKLYLLHQSLTAGSNTAQILQALRRGLSISTMGQTDETYLIRTLIHDERFTRDLLQSINDLRDDLLIHLNSNTGSDDTDIEGIAHSPAEPNDKGTVSFTLTRWSELPLSWKTLGLERSRILDACRDLNTQEALEIVDKEVEGLYEHVMAALKDVYCNVS